MFFLDMQHELMSSSFESLREALQALDRHNSLKSCKKFLRKVNTRSLRMALKITIKLKNLRWSVTSFYLRGNDWFCELTYSFTWSCKCWGLWRQNFFLAWSDTCSTFLSGMRTSRQPLVPLRAQIKQVRSTEKKRWTEFVSRNFLNSGGGSFLSLNDLRLLNWPMISWSRSILRWSWLSADVLIILPRAFPEEEC